MNEPIVKLHDSGKSMISTHSCQNRHAGSCGGGENILEQVRELPSRQDVAKGRFYASKSFAIGSNATRLLISLLCALACTLLTGCRNGNGSVWDENRTTGNYKGSARSLWGGNEEVANDDFFGPNDEEFISLKEEDLHKQAATDGAIPQPKHTPGEAVSGLPGISAFHSPTGSESAIFKNVYFNTDDHILRGKEHTATIDKISAYLKAHADVYVFISGHADERGPEAYNLSLGARRANYIRSLLVEKGVDPERIHTISYGKERPADLGHNQEAWTKNRRGEFRIYHKS